MCSGAFRLHAAPNGAGSMRNVGYKHVAPPEQESALVEVGQLESIQKDAESEHNNKQVVFKRQV